MGPKFSEDHYHRQGWADHPAFPLVEHGDYLALLTLQVEGDSAVLGVVVNNHALGDLNLITWLHGCMLHRAANLVTRQSPLGRTALAGRLRTGFHYLAAQGPTGLLECGPLVHTLGNPLAHLGIELGGGHVVG